MSVLNKLASALGNRSEKPNLQLAASISKSSDTAAVAELVGALSGKDKKIRHDCIKVLYETGTTHPGLICPHTDTFLGLLDSKDNRMQWGAMTALAAITPECPGKIFRTLSRITAASETGSVITRDSCVKILAWFCSEKKYAPEAWPSLEKILRTSPLNQFPMYAELASEKIRPELVPPLLRVLGLRLEDPMKDSARKRVEKVIRKLKSA